MRLRARGVCCSCHWALTQRQAREHRRRRVARRDFGCCAAPRSAYARHHTARSAAACRRRLARSSRSHPVHLFQLSRCRCFQSVRSGHAHVLGTKPPDAAAAAGPCRRVAQAQIREHCTRAAAALALQPSLSTAGRSSSRGCMVRATAASRVNHLPDTAAAGHGCCCQLHASAVVVKAIVRCWLSLQLHVASTHECQCRRRVVVGCGGMGGSRRRRCSSIARLQLRVTS